MVYTISDQSAGKNSIFSLFLFRLLMVCLVTYLIFSKEQKNNLYGSPCFASIQPVVDIVE